MTFTSFKQVCLRVKVSAIAFTSNRRLFTIIGLIFFLIISIPVFPQDPSGANTGTLSDVAAAKSGQPTLSEVGAQAGHNRIAINIVWTLLAGFLFMFIH